MSCPIVVSLLRVGAGDARQTNNMIYGGGLGSCSTISWPGNWDQLNSQSINQTNMYTQWSPNKNSYDSIEFLCLAILHAYGHTLTQQEYCIQGSMEKNGSSTLVYLYSAYVLLPWLTLIHILSCNKPYW